MGSEKGSTFVYQLEIEFKKPIYHAEARDSMRLLATNLLRSQPDIVELTLTQSCGICGEHVGKATRRKPKHRIESRPNKRLKQ